MCQAGVRDSFSDALHCCNCDRDVTWYGEKKKIKDL